MLGVTAFEACIVALIIGGVQAFVILALLCFARRDFKLDVTYPSYHQTSSRGKSMLPIDAILKQIDAADSTADAAVKVAADRKINFLDAPHILPVVSKFATAAAAAPQVWGQVKDLDANEVKVLAERLHASAAKFQAAAEALKNLKI